MNIALQRLPARPVRIDDRCVFIVRRKAERVANYDAARSGRLLDQGPIGGFPETRHSQTEFASEVPDDFASADR